MTENLTEMQKRHKAEIKALQDSCKHDGEQKWYKEAWAVAHPTGREVLVCEVCGAILDNRPMDMTKEGD